MEFFRFTTVVVGNLRPAIGGKGTPSFVKTVGGSRPLSSLFVARLRGRKQEYQTV